MKLIHSLCIPLCLLLTSCFTGVESTPKITYKEVKKQNVTETPEMRILEGIVPTRPSEWEKGKRFFIADNRAARGAWRVAPIEMSDSLAGNIAILTSVDTVSSLTSQPDVALLLSIPRKSTELEFRTGVSLPDWLQTETYTLPHLIDMDLVDSVKERITGRNFYILQPRRYGINDSDTIGTRYQSVRILDVKPYTEATPLRVVFADDEGHISSVPMSIGDSMSSLRNFDTLFSIDNPRKRYPQISDENWELIRHGQLKLGMTPDECRLAIGAPDDVIKIPTTAGMMERWSYSYGAFLQFEDGVLSIYRK